MFQVDDGKAVVVQPSRTAAQAFGETSRALIGHLDTLLGEQLLPVRARSGGQDEPYLLAVDRNGHPVVVEVTALLDPAAIVRALRYTGRVARMSLLDVGALHPGGRERFARDLATFRDSVLVSGLGASAAGARLFLICSEVGEGMSEVVEALTQPGRGVGILQVGVLDPVDGPPLLDVSPARRAAAPEASVHAVEVAARVTQAPAHPAAPAVPAPVPAAGRRSVHPAPDSSTATRPIPVVSNDGVPHRVPTGVRVGVPVPAATDGHAFADDLTAPAPAPATGRRALNGAASHRHTHAETESAEHESNRHVETQVPVRAPTYGPDSRLIALARARGGSVVLVWWRRRRGVLHEALLHEDGSIELADGTRATDPSVAAEIVSDAHGPVDGWRVWRLEGGEGPTLAQAAESGAWSGQPQP